MVIGVWISYRTAEGLVDRDYYEKGKVWFNAKSDEVDLGLTVSGPGKLKTGHNQLAITLRSHSKPLTGATIAVFLGRVPATTFDRTVGLRETAPGLYEAEVELPSAGKWLLRADLVTGKLKTERSWFIDVN